jgi:hypothetical protein
MNGIKNCIQLMACVGSITEIYSNASAEFAVKL